MDSTPEQLRFASIPGCTIRADFAGGGLSSDLGPLLLTGVDHQIGLTERVCAAIDDTRHLGYITHNHEHRHSAIRFDTPGERHAGLDVALLSKRVEVYEAAKARHPERWSGASRNWQPIKVVYLNPDQRSAEKGVRKELSPELKKAA